MVIYIMALGYIVEELTRMWKIGVVSCFILDEGKLGSTGWLTCFFSTCLQYPALTYWFFVNALIYTFMAVALG
jgi:hypothetical protein